MCINDFFFVFQERPLKNREKVFHSIKIVIFFLAGQRLKAFTQAVVHNFFSSFIHLPFFGRKCEKKLFIFHINKKKLKPFFSP